MGYINTMDNFWRRNKMTKIKTIKIKGWEITKCDKMDTNQYDIYDDKLNIMIHVDNIKINKSAVNEWLYLYCQKESNIAIWIDNKKDIDQIRELIEMEI